MIQVVAMSDDKPKKEVQRPRRRSKTAATLSDDKPKKEAYPRKRRPNPRETGTAAAGNKPAKALAIPPEGIRLNRYLSLSGVASRRKADDLIAQGRIKINGETVTALGTKVQKGDRVEVGGRTVSPQAYLYLLLNKPTDTITTTDDEKGRATVLDLIDMEEALKKGLFPVGRLDRNTAGVLLITNDGELAHRLMHPSFEVEKLYTARTRSSIKPDQLQKLRDGIELEDGLAKADRVAYVSPDDHHTIGLQLHEGRNRQIRRMLEALGHEVVALERVGYAGFTTARLRRGKWRRLEEKEIHRLKRQVKLKG